jgi:small subunit ribosomal protein S2
MYTYTIKLVYWQLLLYGCHVGHSFKNSIIFSGWMIYTYRQDILIINLFKTIWLLRIGYKALNAASKLLGPTWFINLNKSLDLYTIYSAKQAGEFSYVTYWIYGMISNWLVLGTTFRKLNRMISSAHKGQFKKLDFGLSQPWLESRISWPRAAFILSISDTAWPAKECLTNGIPCLGICDSDISGHLANIPIPGNDDSLDSIIFFSTIFLNIF